MASQSKKVTVIIPAFNEEKTIRQTIAGVRPYCGKVLVALAKRSNDRTEEIIKLMKVPYFRDRGFGKGDGMRLAIQKVNDGIIVFIDSDGSHISRDIPELVKPIADGRAEMVIASRFLGGSEELHGDFSKFLRMFFSMCIAQIINWRFKKTIMDTQNGFRAIDAQAAKKLSLISNHTEIETEMVMKCYKNRFRILEVPSRELKRKFGRSNINLWKHGWRYLWTVLRNLV